MTVLTAIYDFVATHPFWSFFIYGCWTTFVGSLRAPTKDSSQVYVSTFAVLNFTVLQFGRMFPKVENSPNFPDAVNLQQQIAGQPQTQVKVPPTVEDKPKS